PCYLRRHQLRTMVLMIDCSRSGFPSPVSWAKNLIHLLELGRVQLAHATFLIILNTFKLTRFRTLFRFRLRSFFSTDNEHCAVSVFRWLDVRECARRPQWLSFKYAED